MTLKLRTPTPRRLFPACKPGHALRRRLSVSVVRTLDQHVLSIPPTDRYRPVLRHDGYLLEPGDAVGLDEQWKLPVKVSDENFTLGCDDASNASPRGRGFVCEEASGSS